MSKNRLGQFYSTNANQLLDNLVSTFKLMLGEHSDVNSCEYSNVKGHSNVNSCEYSNGRSQPSIIEPFCGDGDLIKYFIKNNIVIDEFYDIDPKYNGTQSRDTLMNHPSYDNKFVITNPPYLAKNKIKEQSTLNMFTKPYIQDLYHIFIDHIIDSQCLGGILILPINFITSQNNVLRKLFLNKYKILQLNIFEDQMFDDTTQAIVSFVFQRCQNELNDFIIKTNIVKTNIVKTNIVKTNIVKTGEPSQHPSDKTREDDPPKVVSTIDLILEDSTIGKNIFEKKYNTGIQYKRYTRDYKDFYLSNIFIQTVDPNIVASYQSSPIKNKDTDRSKLNLMLSKQFTEQQQRLIIDKFNQKLQFCRQQYYSLFMSSYREFIRKRLSFDQVYILIDNIIGEYILDQESFQQQLNKCVKEMYNQETHNFINNIQQYQEKIKVNYNTFFRTQFQSYQEYYQFVVNNKENPFVIKQFIKEPSKQSIHEKIQIQMIEKKLGMKFKKTKDHFLDQDTQERSKTFDAKNKENKIYLVCKYINEAGGSQDNQFNDMMSFNQQCNYKIKLVISGDYGIKKMNKWLKNNTLEDNVEFMVLQ